MMGWERMSTTQRFSPGPTRRAIRNPGTQTNVRDKRGDRKKGKGKREREKKRFRVCEPEKAGYFTSPQLGGREVSQPPAPSMPNHRLSRPGRSQAMQFADETAMNKNSERTTTQDRDGARENGPGRHQLYQVR
ncbi:hypothetical protein D8B26_006720 [Coccidioides posadasii str. Silveira]|uniref:uncharacterized protein n=1 Tax=Coccidioides posadasii (strain RMSCC 757 / Silveira) TaxID=443226 RepID=UPI001BEF5640|nr:hypothetical protein D8B26_006720 [Coccidioides posadasii str. Silveira]